ncbi:uncharacterized protein LOC143300180 [Babylonia areolata]|uniref:uncharacterized protein LOC143300180 n=1 Tax=Babylonia areolata TaxID=304850 RepID=UPI003FD1CE9C
MTTSFQRLQRLLRAYPSLNLRIEVDKDHHQAHINLPGLRYDDIDFTGQPSMWRLLNMIGRAEHAAFYNSDPFLKYTKLTTQGISSSSAEITMEIGKHFYEVTTPKSPVQVKLNIIGISNTTFTTCMSVMVGGRLKPSVQVKSLNVLRHRESGLLEQVPQWWRDHFSSFLPEFPEKPAVTHPPNDCGQTFIHHLTVPFSDTDTSGYTRHPSYLRYLFDNMSIASHRNFYDKFSADRANDYKVRRLSMVAYGTSQFGDGLMVETFENLSEKDLRLHCFIGKNGAAVWYGCVDFFPPDPPSK